VWDPNLGRGVGGVQERSVRFHRGFVEAAKRSSTTAEVWVNKRIREPNIDGRCAEITLDWLQTLVEDGFEWDEFEMDHGQHALNRSCRGRQLYSFCFSVCCVGKSVYMVYQRLRN
jgi:hypothetical protein